MQPRRVEEGRPHPRRTQRVGHQRAAPGPKLGEHEFLRRAHRLPGGDRPEADQLAEDLADLGRGDEIAAPSERLARRVIAVGRIAEACRHVFGDRHRPAGVDTRREPLGEPRHSPATAAGFRRDAQIMTAMPAKIIGIDSSMPIVSPPER